MKLAHVFIEHSTMHLDRTFSYGCDGFTVCRGMRVVVPFGAKETLQRRFCHVFGRFKAAKGFYMQENFLISVYHTSPIKNRNLSEILRKYEPYISHIPLQ